MPFSLLPLINAALAVALTSQALPPDMGTDIAVNPDFLPAFTARPCTSSTLTTSAGPLRVSGNVLLDMGSGEAYSPSSFQLTTENEFAYNLYKAFGILAVTDPDGNILTFSSAGISHSAGKSVTYARVALGCITKRTLPLAQAESFEYDAAGNRTRATVNGVLSSYFYDQNDRMYFEGANSVPFDANGNMLGLPSKSATYTYDPEDRLTKATHTAGATVDYAYDGDGARIETKVTQGTTVTTTRSLIDKNRAYAEVIEERNEAGTLLAAYTHGHDLEGPVSQERFAGGASTVSYFLTDALGSTRFLVDSTGNVTDGYLYEPYGTVTQRTGSTANPYQFTGEQFDQATGMTYLRARWMANGMARFVTVDPHLGTLHRPLSLNHYVYGHANPATYRDPSGQSIVSTFATAATSIVIGIPAFAQLSVRAAPIAASSMQWVAAQGQRITAALQSTGGYGIRALETVGFATARSSPVTLQQAQQALNLGVNYREALGKLVGYIPTTTELHHVVEQQAANLGRFGTGAIHSVANLVPAAAKVHRAITGVYNSKIPPNALASLPQSGALTVRDFISSQSWERQYEIGIKIWAYASTRGGNQILFHEIAHILGM